MLAPTFDEGALRSALDVHYRLTNRHATRLSTQPPLVHSINALLMGLALFVVWLLIPEQTRARHRYRYLPRLSRGPPPLRFT
jgi:hypothetical protein